MGWSPQASLSKRCFSQDLPREECPLWRWRGRALQTEGRAGREPLTWSRTERVPLRDKTKAGGSAEGAGAATWARGGGQKTEHGDCFRWVQSYWRDLSRGLSWCDSRFSKMSGGSRTVRRAGVNKWGVPAEGGSTSLRWLRVNRPCWWTPCGMEGRKEGNA